MSENLEVLCYSYTQHESEKPIFLLEPSDTGFPLGMSLGEALSHSLSDILEEEMDSASEVGDVSLHCVFFTPTHTPTPHSGN